MVDCLFDKYTTYVLKYPTYCHKKSSDFSNMIYFFFYTLEYYKNKNTIITFKIRSYTKNLYQNAIIYYIFFSFATYSGIPCKQQNILHKQ